MTSDRFRTGIWLRMILLLLSILAVAWFFIAANKYLTASFLLVLVIVQVISLYKYLEKTFRQISTFFDSIVYDDYSQTFSSHTHNAGLDSLQLSMRKTGNRLKELRREAEESKHFLQSLVQHLPVALLVFDEQEQVMLINPAAKKLLKTATLSNLNDLPDSLKELRLLLKNPETSSSALIRIIPDGQWMEITVHHSSMRLQNNLVHMVAMQNISQELSGKELASWEDMMRVLSHEIMNSITPITSLSSTVNEMLETDETDQYSPELKQSVRTIERRSMGLLKFVENFRQLTRLPQPEYTSFEVNEMLEHLRLTLKDTFVKEGIDCSVSVNPSELKITADRDMLEQVLINLLLNSVHALKQKDNKKIKLKAFFDDLNRVNITVTDNGCGISPEARNKVFIPFYSTRKEGSGIGLSLSRQLIKLHRGTIYFVSEPDNFTTFTLQLP